jgi:hypothetical protein
MPVAGVGGEEGPPESRPSEAGTHRRVVGDVGRIVELLECMADDREIQSERRKAEEDRYPPLAKEPA